MPSMTPSEYHAYLAKLNHASDKFSGGISTGTDREYKLHEQISAECKRRGWIALHGRMDMATGRTVGEPDFVILADAGRVVLVEAKAKDKKASPAQLALHAWAGKLGHTVHVVRSLEEFMRVVE